MQFHWQYTIYRDFSAKKWIENFLQIRSRYSTQSGSDEGAAFLGVFLRKFNAQSNELDENGKFAGEQVENEVWKFDVNANFSHEFAQYGKCSFTQSSFYLNENKNEQESWASS